jgi:hypothetical protein
MILIHLFVALYLVLSMSFPANTQNPLKGHFAIVIQRTVYNRPISYKGYKSLISNASQLRSLASLHKKLLGLLGYEVNFCLVFDCVTCFLVNMLFLPHVLRFF